jgi:hypothetical protein
MKNIPSILTEEQARRLKICPLTLSRANRQACLASSCAAWAWQMWPNHYGPRPDEPVGRCGFVEAGVPFPVTGKGVVECENEESDEF